MYSLMIFQQKYYFDKKFFSSHAVISLPNFLPAALAKDR